VDLDEIPFYFQIHGRSPGDDVARTAVYDLAIGRLLAMAKDADIPLTLFAIGSDLARPQAAARLSEARDAGCEIANHSLDHRYDLVRLGRAEILRQIDEGASAIERAVGVRPVGFRAPGYTVTDEVFDVLAELGVAYDSSVFPCPAYWSAKAAMIGWLSARGRPSRSIVDKPTVLLAPTRPYRVGKPYWRRGKGVLELPIQVTRGLRLPVIGTSIALAGPKGAAGLARMCVGSPMVSLELHGIDLLDMSDGLEALAPNQPDVRVPLRLKLEALHATFEVLRKSGYAFTTVQEAAAYFGPRA
jgi:hypothetical protein